MMNKELLVGRLAPHITRHVFSNILGRHGRIALAVSRSYNVRREQHAFEAVVLPSLLRNIDVMSAELIL